MPRDIRDILKDDVDNRIKLSEDHRIRFEEKLGKLIQPKKFNFYFLKIAASLVLLIGLGYFLLPYNNSDEITDADEMKSLGSISPEMKQVENYYLTAIHYEMASLEVTPESKKILDSYLEKIALLTDQYELLNKELSEKGINEKTINALITNLQLRLQLLLELKDIINELKNT